MRRLLPVAWAVNVRRQAPGRGGVPPGREGGRGAAPPVPPLPAGFGNARQPQPTIETIDSGRRDYQFEAAGGSGRLY